MLEYIHELPADAQRANATHVQFGGGGGNRVLLAGSHVHAFVTYGTVDSEGEFQPDGLAGTHKLVIDDMDAFLQAPSSMDVLPDTIEDQLLSNAAGLALYADENQLWHTQQ